MMIAKTVHRLYLDFEKEERWLNEMAARGLNLVRYHWGAYGFEKGAPGQWVYRIQFLDDDARKPKSREYIEFVAGTGAEPVATYAHWVYFRKPAAEGPFELFSDLDSRLAHYVRVLTFYGAMTVILSTLVAIGISRLVTYAEEAIGPFWGLTIFIPCVVLVAVLFTQTLRLAKRVKGLKERRTIEE